MQKLALTAWLLICASIGCASGAPAREAADLKNVRLTGEYGSRYAAATCNLFTRQDRYSLATFKSSASGVPGALWWDWPGDQIGRWLSVVQVASRLGWTPAAANRSEVLACVLPLQKSHGGFSGEPLDTKDVKVISGNGFALRGLMDAYEDSRDPAVLAAARKLARFFQDNYEQYRAAGPEGSVHEFYGHCLDGLVRLYELGGDAWALDLARQIGGNVGRTRHTHHSLSLIRGELELYRVTGDAAYLKRAADYLGWVRSVRLVTGGVPETMPKSGQDEGCALADYVVANLMMFRATGTDLYLDEAENTLVNHFFMNQFHTGGFGHRAYAPEIVGGKQWQGWDGKFGSENPGCCSLWGQWALGEAARHLITRDGSTFEVNLYPAAEISFPGAGLTVSIESDFPRTTHALLKIDAPKGTSATLSLRVPAWAESAAVTVNGAPARETAANGRVRLKRKWRSGDVVRIEFASGIRLVRWPAADAPTAGIFDGPLCLGVPDSQADVTSAAAVKVQGGKAVLEPAAQLHPINEDWQWPDVKNPRRWRVLFMARD